MVESSAFISPLEGKAWEMKPQKFTARWENQMLPREPQVHGAAPMVLLGNSTGLTGKTWRSV